MTDEEAKVAFDEQVKVRYQHLIFDRIMAMRVERVGGRDIHSLELVRVRDTGKGKSEYVLRAKPEDVERF